MTSKLPNKIYCLNFIFDHNFSLEIKWKKVINDTNYLKSCEIQIFQCKSYSQTDPTSFINSLDVFNDILTHFLTKHTVSLNVCEIGKFGGLLGNPTSRFATTYPKFYELCEKIHQLRETSNLSHPKIRRTGKTTRRISYKEMADIRPLLINGYSEYINFMKSI